MKYYAKRMTIFSWILTSLMTAQVCLSAVLGYDPNASQMPGDLDSNWTMSGTTNPISGFFGGGTLAGLNVSGSDKGNWHYDPAGLAIDPNYTVDFKVLVDSDTSGSQTPIQILLYDNGELVQLKLGAQEGIIVEQEGVGIVVQDPTIVTNDAYHIYRYVRSGFDFEIYMDNIASAVLSGTLSDNNVLPGFDRVLFGRAGSTAGGTAGLDYLIWDNSQAISSPPVAPLGGYDPVNSEMPDDLDAAWIMGGTTNPISSFFAGGSIAGLNVSGSDKGFWYHDGAALSDSGYTIDFRALVDSDPGSSFPIVINLYDSGELVQLKLGAQEGFVVQQDGGGIRAEDPNVVTNDAYHTYRYIRDGQNFTVYQDSNPQPILTGALLNNGVTALNRVLFGKGDSTAGGTAGLDYLKWDNTGANYLFFPEDLDQDFDVDFKDVELLGGQWLDCTSPDSPCFFNVGGGQGLFRDTFDGTGSDLDSNLWNVWEGPGTDNVRRVDGTLIIDGSISGTLRGWDKVVMASTVSFSNPIADSGNNDVLYLYLWNVTPRNFFEPNDPTGHDYVEALGFGSSGTFCDAHPGLEGCPNPDDSTLRDRSAYLYLVCTHPLSSQNITNGEVWAYSRVAKDVGGGAGNVMADDPNDPNVPLDFNGYAADYRVVMDGSSGEALVEYKPVGTSVWLTDASPLTSGLDDFLVERIDDDPLYINFNGLFMYVEIDEVYVAINQDITEPAPVCGDATHPFPGADINQNCNVNFEDFSLMAERWLISY